MDVKHWSKSSQATSIRKHKRKWEEHFDWLLFDDNLFLRSLLQGMQETRSFSSKNRRNMDLEALQKAVEKTKAHANSEIHIHSCEAEMAAARVLQELQKIGDEEKSKNKLAIVAHIHCTHFIVHCHIAHTTKFVELVDLLWC